MAIKTSAVIEDTIHRIPIAELMSRAPSFEWTSLQPRGDFSTRYERVQFEPDNYQIAFVSFHSSQDRAGGSQPRAGTMGRLFLLPLTWAEFVILVLVRLPPRTTPLPYTTARFRLGGFETLAAAALLL